MKYILFFLPLLIVLDIYLWSVFTELLTEANDMAVLIGVLFICVAILAHYLLYKLIKLKFKL